MTQTLETTIEKTAGAVREAPPPVDWQEPRSRLDRFVAELAQMSPQERVRASRYSFTLSERYIYAARYPEEAPTVNGELEWIAATLE